MPSLSNPRGGESLAGAAESWDISEDGRIYTFNLQKNGKWSNGDSVTAQDFVWSWMRVLTPSLGSQYPDMLYYVEGAQEYHSHDSSQGEAQPSFDTVGVKALDDHTLEVTLNNPTPFFLGLLSHYSTWPVHKETVLKHGSMASRQQPVRVLSRAAADAGWSTRERAIPRSRAAPAIVHGYPGTWRPRPDRTAALAWPDPAASPLWLYRRTTHRPVPPRGLLRGSHRSRRR